MQLAFFAHYALISPAHAQLAFARLPEIDASQLRDYAEQCAGKSDDDDDDARDWWGDPMPKITYREDTAIVPVKGPITTGMPAIYERFGYARTEKIGAWMNNVASDPDVKRIILDIDSPGGMVTGTPELASLINAASLEKPVIAHTSGMMDSAAYWLGSQANAVFCTPSADVGCIGVYQMNYDYSGWLKKLGVKAEMIKSGDLKGAGHPDVPLTAEQRKHLQAQIDQIGAQFRAAVKSKRSLVEDDSMRGQSFIGTEAADRNLVAGLRSLDSLL